MPNESETRWCPQSAVRRSPSPSGRGRHVPRYARKPAAGLVKTAFAYNLGDKTCSFSPGEKVRMRGKAAQHRPVASAPSSRKHPGFTHYQHRGTISFRFRISTFGFYAVFIRDYPHDLQNRSPSTLGVECFFRQFNPRRPPSSILNPPSSVFICVYL